MPEPEGKELLKLSTSRFGEIKVEREKVLTMPHGMVGFPERHRYVLLQHRPGSPLHWLQSAEAPELAFVVAPPVVFDPTYQIDLGRSEVELLKIQEPAQVQVWAVVTIPRDKPQDMTANLKAPVVVNLETRLAAQVILENPEYSLHTPLRREASQDK